MGQRVHPGELLDPDRVRVAAAEEALSERLATRDPLSSLLRSLTLDEASEPDTFLGDPGAERGRLFGGLVAAMSVSALARTVEPARRLHSLHAYFLRFGRHGTPIRLAVTRVRDGGSFSTRRVEAEQEGGTIFVATASFCLPEEGVSHQDPAPEAPAPDGLPDRDELRERLVGRRSRNHAVEVRLCDPHPFGSSEPRPARQRLWIRPRGPLPDDPLVHEAVLAYVSDTAFLSTLNLRHPMRWDERSAASLDHALWIHQPPRADDWLLFVCESPVAHAARGLLHGAIYDAAGRRLASVAQEALMRRRAVGEEGGRARASASPKGPTPGS
ncbi:MAG TPA: acyl-CoA thioesterase domain-containing protein [Thermoanaerobaculia bacterium]|nr:acyl-CoA thioesterase domain-containing protein [Thermoanaerobaculia bacterium]